MSEPEKPPPQGRPLAVDPKTESSTPGVPPFVARPPGAPVYHGFVTLDDVVVDGFVLGKITDFEAAPCDTGDGFVIAPDNSRAGLVWEVSDQSYFETVCPYSFDRWGVWAVVFPYPMTSRENARRNLKSVLPLLKPKWREWLTIRTSLKDEESQ